MSGEYNTYADAWQPDNEVAVRGGTIRVWDGIHADDTDPDYIVNPGLGLLNDPGHISVGIVKIRIEKSTGRIVVDTDGATNGVPMPGNDESTVAGGLRWGLTGGSGGQIRIECAKPGTGVMDLADQAVYDSVARPNLNIWFSWMSWLVRGVGLPSKADRALTRLDGHDAQIADILTRLAALESGCA